MNFKLAIAAFFAFLFSAFKVFKFVGKAKANEIKAESEEEARLVQNQAWVKLTEGREREIKEADKPVSEDRTDFE